MDDYPKIAHCYSILFSLSTGLLLGMGLHGDALCLIVALIIIMLFSYQAIHTLIQSRKERIECREERIKCRPEIRTDKPIDFERKFVHKRKKPDSKPPIRREK